MSTDPYNPFAPPSTSRSPAPGPDGAPVAGTDHPRSVDPAAPDGLGATRPGERPVRYADTRPPYAADGHAGAPVSTAPGPYLPPAPYSGAGPSAPAPTGYAPAMPADDGILGYPPLGGVGAPVATDSWGRPVAPARERRGLRAVWVVPMLLGALVAGAVGGVAADRLPLGEARPADAALPASSAGGDIGELTGVAAVAGRVLPSVVSIEVRSTTGEGTGSGFVLRGDGYILTNNHVVSAGADGGAEVVVVFSDGSQEPAEIVGRTAEYDLAVLKVAREGLTPLALGDSDRVVVGDPVVAVGAPLGLQGTVTTGIVSALNRPVSAGNGAEPAFINAIQTDAAINPGNSGGPLVDASGEVIGINSAIAQRPGTGGAGGSIGLGFAIPSNQARRTAEQLIETGSATYPIIGVLLDSRYTGEGVKVSEEAQDAQPPVTPDGPAERAGIAPGDIIIAIDGRPVTESDELIVAIRARAPGDSVTLTVRTGDEGEREVRVVLDEFSSGG